MFVGKHLESMYSRICCSLLTIIGLSSCTVVSTPDQRINLTHGVMQPDRDQLGEAMSDHMYFSREGSSGGNGVGGGGCGCN